jgi:hypothetical protein
LPFSISKDFFRTITTFPIRLYVKNLGCDP